MDDWHCYSQAPSLSSKPTEKIHQTKVIRKEALKFIKKGATRILFKELVTLPNYYIQNLIKRQKRILAEV